MRGFLLVDVEGVECSRSLRRCSLSVLSSGVWSSSVGVGEVRVGEDLGVLGFFRGGVEGGCSESVSCVLSCEGGGSCEQSSGVSVIPFLRLTLSGHVSVVMYLIYSWSCLPILSRCGHRWRPSYLVFTVTMRWHVHLYSLRFLRGPFVLCHVCVRRFCPYGVVVW